MIIYIICFVLSIGCTYLAQKKFKKNEKRAGIIYSFIAILVPSVIAGIRGITVGSDTGGYVQRSFNEALINGSLAGFLETSEKLETGYRIFTYIIAKVFGDIHWLFFIHQFIICLIVYKVAYDRREKIPMYMVMVVYYTIFYSISLNLARQSLAIAIILYSIKFMENRKYIKTLLLLLLAIQFHSSAIFAVFLYFIIFVNQIKIKPKSKIMIFFMIICLLIGIIISYEQILYFMTFNISIIPAKFYNYLNSKYALDTINVSAFEISFKSIWIILSIMYMSITKKDKKYNIESYFIFLIIDLFMFSISFKISNAFRMGHYYGIPAMLLTIPVLTNVFKQDKINKIISTILLVAILVFYWFYSNILYRGSGIYPYVSDVLTILNYLV